MTTKQVGLFIQEFVARVKGDDAEAQAAKTQRKAISQLKTQIAILEGGIIEKEEAVETASQKLEDAIVNNGELIKDDRSYVQGLYNAQNSVTKAEEALEVHKERLEFLKGLLTKIS